MISTGESAATPTERGSNMNEDRASDTFAGGIGGQRRRLVLHGWYLNCCSVRTEAGVIDVNLRPGRDLECDTAAKAGVFLADQASIDPHMDGA